MLSYLIYLRYVYIIINVYIHVGSIGCGTPNCACMAKYVSKASGDMTTHFILDLSVLIKSLHFKTVLVGISFQDGN